MSAEVEEHIAAVEALYAPMVSGVGAPLIGGERLWRQFGDAVAAYRKRGAASLPALFERVNELSVAHILLNDRSLQGRQISYEPPITGDGRRIDFVVAPAAGEALYVEVKTVHPAADDSEEGWQKYQERKEHHPDRVHYLVEKAWLGAAIYGNSFSARSKFMRYSLDFETRLSGANEVQPGPGVLVFCGTGFQWHRSELEDFADFYLDGVHRQDDPFAKMEAEHLATAAIQLQRNIAAFGYVKRPMNAVTAEEWSAAVRGPVWGRGRRSAPESDA